MKTLEEMINEKRIMFNRREPKYNNVVILGGGGGSGKGFISEKLLGIKGKTFDVDVLKEMALKSILVKQKIKSKLGLDISKLDLKNPKDTTTLHLALDDAGLNKKYKDTFIQSIDPNNQHKPNIIFDVTLKDMPKFSSLCQEATMIGYEPKNIHIVWVLNKLSIALEQNRSRNRIVYDDIIISTHKGVALTMKEIFNYFSQNSEICMDGDIWIVFNVKDEDTKLISSEKGGSYIEKATYIQLKESGKKIKSLSEFSDEILHKIEHYHKL